jgi:hypothetical protein
MVPLSDVSISCSTDFWSYITSCHCMYVGFIQHIHAEYKISQFTKCPATCFIKLLSSDSESKTEHPAVNILHFKSCVFLKVSPSCRTFMILEWTELLFLPPMLQSLGARGAFSLDPLNILFVYLRCVIPCFHPTQYSSFQG